ncbi:DUF6597 domain-containing transcriptional factor [Paenibacillus sp. J22TS3]|uniref:DUF6597 domain-containing transcriptional factor n=1 Tax=Paenibacillus sp. J22TS3 TaxID=2807192 RepID=UPI001B2C4628|nr:DUF6597 domain-containing transcriptional factor [Paenibacillus sp. J22TS3]GIP24310.1 hypothetical protein J22TS3_45850 [Paenibacillus sp. J22TS3]
MGKNTKKPSGLLHVHKKAKVFSLDLISSSSDLDLYVEHYWIVHWDLRGQGPQISENLPHPSVHLVAVSKQQRTLIFAAGMK